MQEQEEFSVMLIDLNVLILQGVFKLWSTLKKIKQTFKNQQAQFIKY